MEMQTSKVNLEKVIEKPEARKKDNNKLPKKKKKQGLGLWDEPEPAKQE